MMDFKEARNCHIMDRVAAHYERATEHYGEDNVLGVFLYGSQNYDCDLENSDVDTKCILIPDLYHLALHPYKTNHLHVYAEGREEPEVCECMTLQHMVANWKKQNPNFLEIMFTQYACINPKYYDEWVRFLVREGFREEIARYDVRGGVLSIAHQAIHTINQNPMDGKKIGNGYRLLQLLDNYVDGVPYNVCLTRNNNEVIREFKSGAKEVFPEYANVLIEKLEKHLDNIDSMGNYPDRDGIYTGPRHELDVPLDDFMMRLIKIQLALE